MKTIKVTNAISTLVGFAKKVAVLIPMPVVRGSRELGMDEGRLIIPADFDDPLEEDRAYFG